MYGYQLPEQMRRHRKFYLNKVFLLSEASKYVFFGLIGLIVLFFLYFIWISRDLPTPGKLANSDIHDSTKIRDKNGVILYSIYKQYDRIYIPLKEIPKTLQESTVAAEDEDFYKNSGFSVKGYLRAFRDALLNRRISGGGSTITQQLVKNALLSSEQSLTRKLKELILAIQVDKRYSKQEVLEMYLNNVPYGGTAVGVEAASNLYFDKHAKDLDLAQSAFIAGLTQAPSYYSPYTNKDKTYIPRSQYVLERLYTENYITKKQKDDAIKEVKNFKFQEKQANMKAPHFVMYVKDQLSKMFGESVVENGNLDVTTTLDYDIQKNAEKITNDEIDSLKGYNAKNGAAIVLDVKNGAILSMVGSKDYFDLENDGNFNAALGKRQPGSSLKPIVYATAFEKGYTPASLILDVKTDFPTDDVANPIYTPVNYDGKYHGPMQIRFALGNSENVPAVKTLARVGVKPVMQKAYEMGIENWKPTSDALKNVGLSLVLGGREATLLQITSAYSVFANQGVKKDPFAIVEVKDSKGKVLYKHEDTQGVNVLTKEISFLISHILLDNNARQPAFGASSWLVVPGRTVSVKTGTTDEKRDNWTIGYTPSYVVGVWVGNNDNSKMNPAIASGITGATPIWNKIMTFVLKGKKDEVFQKPDNVVATEIDSFSGGLPKDGQSKRTEYFLKGTEPTSEGSIYKKIKISKHQGDKLANQAEIDHNDYDVKDFIVFSESDPVSKDGKNRWQEGIDSWLKETHSAAEPQYYPPTQTSDYKYSESSNNPTSTPSPTPSITVTPTVTPTP